MKTLLLVLILLALVITAYTLEYTVPGQLTISYPGWIIKTTPAAFLIIYGVAVFCALIALKLVSLLTGLPRFLSDRSQSGSRIRGQRRLTKGFIEFTEGRWRQAEKLLARFDKKHDTALINCLTAARAAQFQGDFDRRDRYLERAANLSVRAATAIDITRAQLQIDQRDYDSALETLVFLRTSVPRNACVIALLASVYKAKENWSKLDALLPVVRRHKSVDAAVLESLEQACWRGMIKTAEEVRLARYWKRLPKQVQHSPEMLILFVSRMMLEGKHGVAEKMLRGRLTSDWSDELVTVYSRVKLDDAPKQLEYAETWLAKHGRSAALLLTLGQLCLRCQLWGKARVYLESSLGIQNSAHASLALAELLAQLGEIDNATKFYAAGLRLALDQSQEPLALPAAHEVTTDADDTGGDETQAAAESGDLDVIEKRVRAVS